MSVVGVGSNSPKQETVVLLGSDRVIHPLRPADVAKSVSAAHDDEVGIKRETVAPTTPAHKQDRRSQETGDFQVLGGEGTCGFSGANPSSLHGKRTKRISVLVKGIRIVVVMVDVIGRWIGMWIVTCCRERSRPYVSRRTLPLKATHSRPHLSNHRHVAQFTPKTTTPKRRLTSIQWTSSEHSFHPQNIKASLSNNNTTHLWVLFAVPQTSSWIVS